MRPVFIAPSRSALRFASIAAALLMTAQTGAAQEVTDLFRKGDWIVRHEFYPDSSSQACAARSSNAKGDTIDFTLWDDSSHTLWLFMADAPWSGTFEDDLKIHIGREQWTLQDAEFEDDTVKFTFANIDNFFEFLDDVMAGSSLALKTPDERRDISVWSLSGSSASIRQLFECHDRISAAAEERADNSGATYGGGQSTYGGGSRYGD